MTLRHREAAERYAERRRREDQAPRLLSVVPRLSTLRIKLEERRGGSSLVETAHVRPIVVASAPALFVFPCQDTACKDGGHDMTALVCNFLRAGKEQFEGEHSCHGLTGTAECGRLLRIWGEATYRP